MKILIPIIHIIGAIITLIVLYKNGTLEDAAKNGDGFYTATPADVVFGALFLWEIYLLLLIICSIDAFIDDFFRNKFCGKEEENNEMVN